MATGSQRFLSELNSGDDIQSDDYCVQFGYRRKDHLNADSRRRGASSSANLAAAMILEANCITSHDVSWTEDTL